MLTEVTAVRYVTPLKEGGSLPGIVEADDDGTYVLKFRGAGQGLKVLVAEVIVAGLARLKSRYVVTTLSNGNFSLLTNMAKHAGLPWDCIISAELFRHYKPDPETYLGAADLLGVDPAELMLVACHPDDLRAARACGCRTGYVERPLELGAGGTPPPVEQGEFDVVVGDFVELANRLGA